jgi:hypothetical protein
MEKFKQVLEVLKQLWAVKSLRAIMIIFAYMIFFSFVIAGIRVNYNYNSKKIFVNTFKAYLTKLIDLKLHKKT